MRICVCSRTVLSNSKQPSRRYYGCSRSPGLLSHSHRAGLIKPRRPNSRHLSGTFPQLSNDPCQPLSNGTVPKLDLFCPQNLSPDEYSHKSPILDRLPVFFMSFLQGVQAPARSMLQFTLWRLARTELRHSCFYLVTSCVATTTRANRLNGVRRT